jgi:hypothetical protein
MFDNLLNPTQGSVGNWKVARVQDLNARVMVAVEGRHRGRTPRIPRLCRVGKPQPEMVQFDRDGRAAGV